MVCNPTLPHPAAQPQPGPPPAAPPHRIRWPVRSRGLLAGGILLSLLILCGGAVALWRAREAAIEDWKIRAAGFTTILAEHANQTIRGADLVLRSIQREVDEARLDTPRTAPRPARQPRIPGS
ncbi:hypothetical protein [Dankookia sp. P2]|uniref:hypothetical protein n=1 Tax=Dankookia sp. P2 TaxID=3423955 RepID=UPI003D677995